MECIKCVLVGDGFVGKTALVGALNNNECERYTPTIFDNTIVSVKYKDLWVNIGVFDTAGQEEYDKLRPIAYTNTNVFLVCFSLVDANSLENVLNKWISEIKEHCPKSKILLVGTKLDLWNNADYANRAISQERIEEVVRDINAVDYIRVSSLKKTGVTDVFTRVADISMNCLPEKKRRHTSDCSVM